MRRSFAFLLAVSALGLLTPTVFGQYPYPYGPMPVQYAPMPPYGYPMPMPNPQGAPMYYQPAPMYYQPAPMMRPPMQGMQGMQMPAANNTKVFVYGPLDDAAVVVPANPVAPAPRPMPLPAKADAAPIGISQTQAPAQPMSLSQGGYRMLPTYSKADFPEASGPGCDGPACGPACGAACGPACGPACAQAYEPPMRGRGHFIGEVATSFLVPIFSSRTAFNSTPAGGGTTGTDFSHPLDVASQVSLGYICHTGWGVRASYLYLNGSVGQSTTNADPTFTIATPTAPLGLTSPSPTLAQGIGVDQFTFKQRLEMNVADIEVIKEASFMDTAFLLGFGARYANVRQSYSATRTNPGGNNGVTTVAFDREDLDTFNRFEGWGPTVSLDIVHPLTRWGLSAYATARGSFLWGVDRFGQTYRTQNNSVDAFGNPTFIDATNANDGSDHRFVSVAEAEAGLQYGCRIGRCYWFARAGATYQRWWDVGNPTTSQGNVSFIGGTARVGVTY